MVSPEKTNWLYDYVVEDVAVPEGNFSAPDSLFSWSVNGSSTASVENDFSFGDSDVQKELGSKKRARAESCAPSSYKARREKLRRDKMNDKFMKLSALLDPGRPPKTDKAAILLDNTFAPMVMSPARLGADVVIHSISKYISGGADIIAVPEKNELRDEKQRLKTEKEKLEQQLKTTNVQPGFLPAPAMPAVFAAQGQATANKFVPVISYPGVAMWQSCLLLLSILHRIMCFVHQLPKLAVNSCIMWESYCGSIVDLFSQLSRLY